MQQGTTIELSHDAVVLDNTYIQEKLRQADMLAQISRTADGIKSAFTICVTALCVCFVAGKVVPFAAKTTDTKSKPGIASVSSGTHLDKRQTVAAVNNEILRSNSNSISHATVSISIDRAP